MWSDSKKKWLPCVSDFEAYWLASKWLRWKIDYLETRAVITDLIFVTNITIHICGEKNVMWCSKNLINSNCLWAPKCLKSNRPQIDPSRPPINLCRWVKTERQKEINDRKTKKGKHEKTQRRKDLKAKGQNDKNIIKNWNKDDRNMSERWQKDVIDYDPTLILFGSNILKIVVVFIFLNTAF